MMDDQAYLDYPKLRHLYNKLWLSEELGYYCGPCGLAPDKSGWFMVRPIINLSGMGVGSKKVWIDAGDATKVPPGYFWCEFFEGRHLSISYKKIDECHKIKSCYEGFKNSKGTFIRWEKTDIELYVPKHIKRELCNILTYNVEYIGGKIIELHLRDTPDPEYDILMPIWKSNIKNIDKFTTMGYDYYSSYDNADGFLSNPRLGFMVKNKEIDDE